MDYTTIQSLRPTAI
uniref:Uncharacterized protein n=1 Tax=Anguilla anguilla TaxID=7936 RepID=A0A0E9UIZ7_ANGAN